MSKKNFIYKVVVYIGGISSHDCKVIHIDSKESEAEDFLHNYLKNHPEVCKAYIERAFNKKLNRNKYELEE